MKAFWTILALLVVAGAVALLVPRSNQKPASEPTVGPAPASVPASAPASSPANEAAKDLAKDLLTERAANAGKDAAPAASDGRAPPPGESLPLGLDKAIKHAKVQPSQLVRQPDGSLLADGKYLIKGSGTASDPYVVRWELLKTAMDTFQPREQLDGIPQAVALLDGAHVRIEGYVAFPLIATQSKQLIAMMNQWDGCCIGVPPTAFDAVEVNLAKEVAVNRRHVFLYGTLEGTFHVEPNVVDSWLVGLYILDDATLTIDL